MSIPPGDSDLGRRFRIRSLNRHPKMGPMDKAYNFYNLPPGPPKLAPLGTKSTPPAPQIEILGPWGSKMGTRCGGERGSDMQGVPWGPLLFLFLGPLGVPGGLFRAPQGGDKDQ